MQLMAIYTYTYMDWVYICFLLVIQRTLVILFSCSFMILVFFGHTGENTVVYDHGSGSSIPAR